jgi:hypothetical protein
MFKNSLLIATQLADKEFNQIDSGTKNPEENLGLVGFCKTCNAPIAGARIIHRKTCKWYNWNSVWSQIPVPSSAPPNLTTGQNR